MDGFVGKTWAVYIRLTLRHTEEVVDQWNRIWNLVPLIIPKETDVEQTIRTFRGKLT